MSGPVDAYADTVHDTARALLWLTRPLAVVSVPVIACLVAVAMLHHAAAALAARAAAGVPMPVGELIAAQFAASAANRITPGGLGGAGLLGRYFHRRARLRPAQATAAVAALAVLGALADLAAFGALLLFGALLGASSMTRETPALVDRLVHLVPLPAGWLRWALLAAAVLGASAAIIWRQRLPATARQVAGAVRHFAADVAHTARSPGRLTLLVSASAATTLLLAAGFAATAVLVSPGLPAHDLGALMIGYMIAAAAGNALPTPGGIGSADAALVGVLLAASMPVAPAVAVVLAFRAVTFWAPAAVGLGALPTLRRHGAL